MRARTQSCHILALSRLTSVPYHRWDTVIKGAALAKMTNRTLSGQMSSAFGQTPFLQWSMLRFGWAYGWMAIHRAFEPSQNVSEIDIGTPQAKMMLMLNRTPCGQTTFLQWPMGSFGRAYGLMAIRRAIDPAEIFPRSIITLSVGCDSVAGKARFISGQATQQKRKGNSINNQVSIQPSVTES